MTPSHPTTSRHLRKSRGDSSHPIPAGSTPASAGKVCPPPVTETKTATSTNQSQSVATRGRPQSRERGSCQEQLLAPEQGETGPPPEDLESEEGLPVKTQWMTSWTSYPQVGEGT